MELIADPKNGDILDASDTMYPSSLFTIRNAVRAFTDKHSTFYGYVVRGSAQLSTASINATVKAGTFFSSTSHLVVETDGTVVIFERHGYRGLTVIGTLEATGRLAYIDGCSSTILVLPARLGDPVFNHLHFPTNVLQTEHIHPSIRLGVVARGQGIAFGSGNDGKSKWELPLTEGSIFYLPALQRHAFQTLRKSEPLDIISYHPDSDWGPTDQAHPMRSKTLMQT